MNLAIDIGNTSVKLGVFDGERLVETYKEANAVEVVFSNHDIQGVILTKSGKGSSIEDYLQQNRAPYLVVSHRLKLPVKILYKTPETLGGDRIAGSVAANALFPHQPVLKIDFGTCITYDFIGQEDSYFGGAISPGMAMRFKALNHYTSGLPLVEPHQHTAYEFTGADTQTSILSGVINGIREEVQGIIKHYELRFGSLKVVGTGGDMGFFGAVLKNEIFVRPNLVLEGLNTILNYNS